MHKLSRNFFPIVLLCAGAATSLGADAPLGATPAVTPTATPPLAETNSLGAKIQFAMPVYDFGKVQAGEMVKYSFVFTNTGDQLLEVTAVQPSCGCTAAGDWSRKVPPGQTGIVPVQFNSANFNGQVYKTVSVTSSDRQRPTTVLQLKGTVWKSIELIPQYTVMNVSPDASGASATVRIVNHQEEPLMISAPESSNPSFGVTLVTNQPGKEYQLTIASVKELNSGNVQGKVTLKTSAAKTPTLDVPFWVNVQPVISVIPQRISLPQAPLRAKAPATITIQNNSTNTLTLSEAAVNAPGVEVQLKEVQPGRIYTAMLTFPEGFEAPAGAPVMLSMKSSQPRMPEIRVPVFQPAHPVTGGPPMPKPQLPPAPTGAKPTASVQPAH
jgi:hypothetical protein